MKIKKQLNKIISDALDKSGISVERVSVNEASKAEFGDYQYNGIMPLAKPLRRNPREIAMEVVANIPENSMIEKVEIAGPGFINIWLNTAWLESMLTIAMQDKRLSVSTRENPIKTVVDYSSPNMAKQMHVGHLRSTIIGDTLAKLFEFLGDEVIRQNHIGDWGTQFGMLIAYLELSDTDADMSLGDLEEFYKNAKAKFDEDSKFADRAREYVVKLQSGDEHCLSLWEQFIDVSLKHCEDIYSKLGISLDRESIRAESSYNDQLPKIVNELIEKNLLVDSDGAKCIFVDGNEVPFIVQKSDGGFLYATTDLAAIKFRAEDLQAQRISYVVDARQAGHFSQLFQIARDAKIVNDFTILEHVSFGMMLDKSGKPFKTRDGGTVKLIDLLDEAVTRANSMIEQRGTQEKDDIDRVAQIVGIGAVKYAELSINRESNYVFDWNKMLSMDGNTSLYLQYAYARINSIFAKYDGEIKPEFKLGDDLEKRLAVMILRFEDVLYGAAKESMPHYISTYLYDLTTLFMKFYEQNPILKSDVAKDIQKSRLALSSLVSSTIKQGLDILGIEVLDKL